MYVYKYGKFKFETPFLSFQAKKNFICKSKVCPMTGFSGSGTGDKIDFDGKTLLLECEDNEYIYTSGLEIFKFKTDDKNIDYISLMGNNMISYTIAVGKNIHTSYHLITNYLKTIKLKEELY